MPRTLDFSKPAPNNGGYNKLLAGQGYKIGHDKATLKSHYVSKEANGTDFSHHHTMPQGGHFQVKIPKEVSYLNLNEYFDEVMEWLDLNVQEQYRWVEKTEGVPSRIGATPDKDQATVCLFFKAKSDANNFEKAFIEFTKSPFVKVYQSNSNFEKKTELGKVFGKALSFGWRTDEVAAAPAYPDIIDRCIIERKNKSDIATAYPVIKSLAPLDEPDTLQHRHRG